VLAVIHELTLAFIDLATKCVERLWRRPSLIACGSTSSRSGSVPASRGVCAPVEGRLGGRASSAVRPSPRRLVARRRSRCVRVVGGTPPLSRSSGACTTILMRRRPADGILPARQPSRRRSRTKMEQNPPLSQNCPASSASYRRDRLLLPRPPDTIVTPRRRRTRRRRPFMSGPGRSTSTRAAPSLWRASRRFSIGSSERSTS